MDIERFNADWLAAWSRKDVPALLGFYSEAVTYKDNQVPNGIVGHAALKLYLEGLFAATPAMEYIPDATWPILGGYCGRWNSSFGLPDGTNRTLRGFDLVLLDGERISYNEVYTHTLPA